MDEKKGFQDELKEVDFEPLIAWFLAIMKKLQNLLSFVLRSLKRQKKAILTFIVVGFACGTVMYFMSPKKYSMSLQLMVKHTNNQTSYNLVGALGRLAYDKSYNSLAKELGLQYEQVKGIKHIGYRNHNFEIIQPEDTIVERKAFFIEVHTRNPYVADTLQQALVNYIENQPLTKEVREQRIEEINKRLNRLGAELRRIDSLKSIVAQSIEPRSNAQGIIFGEPVDPVSIYKESERLSDSYIYHLGELNTISSVKIVSPFVVSEKPIFPRIRHIVFVALGFLGAGILFAFYREYKSE